VSPLSPQVAFFNSPPTLASVLSLSNARVTAVLFLLHRRLSHARLTTVACASEVDRVQDAIFSPAAGSAAAVLDLSSQGQGRAQIVALSGGYYQECAAVESAGNCCPDVFVFLGSRGGKEAAAYWRVDVNEVEGARVLARRRQRG
jgi:hypothetical protein